MERLKLVLKLAKKFRHTCFIEKLCEKASNFFDSLNVKNSKLSNFILSYTIRIPKETL